MEILPTALACLAAYVIGATPWGFWAGKIRGIDVRDHGSGNIGTTNVFRTLGKGPGIVVFLLDVLKGLVPVLLARQFLPGVETWQIILVAIAAILGHNFTFWLRFKGGKGIATSTGAVAAVVPLALLVGLIVWIALFVTTRYVAVASIGCALALPATVAAQGVRTGQWDPWLLGFACFLCAMAIWRHRSNVGRLRAGTENRFGKEG